MSLSFSPINRIQLAELFIHGGDGSGIEEINADIAGRPSGGDHFMAWLEFCNRSLADISSRANNENAHHFFLLSLLEIIELRRRVQFVHPLFFFPGAPFVPQMNGF
jgi:hypothetical protein